MEWSGVDCSEVMLRDIECIIYICILISYSMRVNENVWRSLHYNVNKIDTPKVAIIREEGSNGDREMCAAFYGTGFEVYDVCMNDLVTRTVTLDKFDGIVFVGGFSFSDVFGAAAGWGAIIENTLSEQFNWFYEKQQTRFSLGVCNGCQLMCRMGWVGNKKRVPERNKSGRFESRFVNVLVKESPSIFLKGLEGSVIGTWVAHGEGRFIQNYDFDFDEGCCPLRYASVIDGKPTSVYPFNPNGSDMAVAGMISADGLHLAMMPHPERCIKRWQNPWIPSEWSNNIDNTCDKNSMPWTMLFRNAYEFAVNIK